MAEYHAVLKKAVRAHGARSAEARRAMYEKARSAIVDRLKAIDPPLAPLEISRQQLEFEEAIRRLEREASGEGQDERPIRSAASEPVQIIGSDPELPPQQWGSSSPQDIFRGALQDVEARGAAAGRSATRTRTAAPDEDTGANAEQTGNRAQRRPPESRAETDLGGLASRPAAKYDDDWQPRETAEGRSSEPHPERRSAPRLHGPWRLDDPYEEQALPASARRPRLPPILLIILIVALIGGAGVVSWLQRADFPASADGGSTGVLAPDTLPAPPDIGPKSQDRLADRLGPDSPGRIVGEADPRDLFAPPDVSTVPTIDAIADAPLATTGAAAAGQAAVLYEEPLKPAAASSGMSTTEGVVNWQFIEDGTSEPEILADLQVPQRGMDVRLVIRRVSEPTLPASHLVEAVITTPPDFPGRGIRSVPRIVFRAGENDSGEPLIGAAGEVADGAFWIALSAAEADVARNLQLLKERSWIDLPLVYETGQRAILAFEKGPEGTQVFEDAFAAWDAGKK